MAKPADIGSDTTLEIDGDLPSPNQIASILRAFSTLLDRAHKKCGTTIKWGVQVKEGSNLFQYVPKGGEINKKALVIIEKGIKELQSADAFPPGYDEDMARSLRTISKWAKRSGKQNNTIRLWLNKKPINIGEIIKENINAAIEESFTEYGSVEGKVEILDSHGELEFSIYEPLDSGRIKCIAKEREVFDTAYKFYEKCVEAEGFVKYNNQGIPYEIKVEKITSLIPDEGLPDYKLTKGILKPYAQ